MSYLEPVGVSPGQIITMSDERRCAGCNLDFDLEKPRVPDGVKYLTHPRRTTTVGVDRALGLWSYADQ